MARDDGTATVARPTVTIGLIVLCCWVFAWQLALGSAGAARVVYAFGLVPAVLTGQATLPADLALLWPPAAILASLFVHPGPLELVLNALYLWRFGPILERVAGPRQFLGVYLIGGIFAALMQTVSAPHAVIPIVGAGGAVSAVLGAWLLLQLRDSGPATAYADSPRLGAGWLLVMWWVCEGARTVLADPSAPGLGVAGAAGGFVTGAVLLLFLRRRDAGAGGPDAGADRTR